MLCVFRLVLRLEMYLKYLFYITIIFSLKSAVVFGEYTYDVMTKTKCACTLNYTQ